MGHMLEERGFSTVAIASVRAQAEKTKPPRALWTSSMLGRPFGEPDDPAFQKRVLLAALHLLERTDGPVILEDFDDDPPSWTDNPAWKPPATDPAEDFAAELARMIPLWRARPRTTVGLGFQAPEAWPGFVDQALSGALPSVPDLPTAALAIRMMCDDVKALYGEAAQTAAPYPSAHQVDHWFWRETAAGRVLLRLRDAAMASENNALKTVGGRFFVPAPWLPKPAA